MPNLKCALVAGLAAFGTLSSMQAVRAEPVAQTVPPSVGLLGVKPLGSEGLAAYRGGTQVVNDMKLRGVVADNQAINVTTGSNLITDGALTGAAGVATVIQNSGNNVLIQSATIVNVQLK